MNTSWLDQMVEVCEGLNKLRSTIASKYRSSDGTRANEYLSEAKSLIETAYDVLRREDRWAKRALIRQPQRELLH